MLTSYNMFPEKETLKNHNSIRKEIKKTMRWEKCRQDYRISNLPKPADYNLIHKDEKGGREKVGQDYPISILPKPADYHSIHKEEKGDQDYPRRESESPAAVAAAGILNHCIWAGILRHVI